jgi:DNA-directed RNA polymerase subunit beta
VRVFNRHGVEKDERAMAIEREEIERLAKDRDDEQAILDRNVYGRLSDMLKGKKPSPDRRASRRAPRSREELLPNIRVRSGGVRRRRREAQGEIEALRAVRRFQEAAGAAASWTRSRRSSAATNCRRA